MSHYRYLVFSGGGAAGVAYAGALQQLGVEPSFSFADLKGIAGTSVGAIAALVVSLKFSPEEASDKLAKLDLKKLADANHFPFELHDLFSTYGKYKGDAVYQFILSLIKEKTHREDPENVTFADLHAMGFTDLYVVATKMFKVNDKPTGKKKVFSFGTTPNTPVAAAIRASAAAPLYFKNVRLKKMEKGKYILHREGDWFSDGGLVDNYPLTLFDKPEFMEMPQNNSITQIINPNTLGLALCTADQIMKKEHKAVKSKIEDGYPIEGAKGVINTLLNHFNEEGLDQAVNRERTIEIDRLGVSLGKFDMNQATKQRLINSGKESVQKYFHPQQEDKNAEINTLDIHVSNNNNTWFNVPKKPVNDVVENKDEKKRTNTKRCIIL